MLQDGAGAGALVQLGDGLLAALGEAEEGGEHAGAEDQPLRGVGVDGAGAGRHPQDEEAGQGHHVDDHDLLEAEAVGHLGDPVAGHHQPDLPVDGGEGKADRPGRQQRRDGDGGALRELARGQRPEPLLRVLAVELDVDQVVDEVAGAGDRAEGDEGQCRLQHRVRLVELAGEQQPGEDQDVLDPLVRPPGLDRGPQRRAPRHARGGLGLPRLGRDGRMFRSDRVHLRGPAARRRGPPGQGRLGRDSVALSPVAG